MGFPRIITRLFANAGAGPKLRRSIMPGLMWDPEETYDEPTWCRGSNGKIYMWNAPSGLGVSDVGPKDPVNTESAEYWVDFVGSMLELIPAGMPRGATIPFHNVTFAGSDGRRPIFWGATTPDEGWVIADGGSDGAGGKVPDARDRMIMGAGGSYAAGSTGGAVTHSHSVSGSAGSATLSTSQMPSHGHTFSTGDAEYTSGADATAGDYKRMASVSSTGGSSSHSHSLSAAAAAANGLPPYYALALCVKV